jgi:hypothetical protein
MSRHFAGPDAEKHACDYFALKTGRPESYGALFAVTHKGLGTHRAASLYFEGPNVNRGEASSAILR